MDNQFIDKYKTLDTKQLLEIIENYSEYQPLAIATAKKEIESRSLSALEVETLKREITENKVKATIESEKKEHRQEKIRNKLFGALDYANPFTVNTPDKSLIFICLTLLVFIIFKLPSSYHYIKLVFTKFNLENAFTFLEVVWLPITIFLFWKKKQAGRIMLNIWLCYNLLWNCALTYYAYQMKDVDGAFATMITIPNLSTCIYLFVFYGGLLYYINTSRIKNLFKLKSEENLMTIEELHNRLNEMTIPSDKYYLQGLHGSTDDNNKPALTIRKGQNTIEYEVYYKESGEKGSSKIFSSEDEACNYIFKQLVDGFTFEKIQNIIGLEGMTVNERLYESGLIDEFYEAKQNDKKRAKEILRWLRVDENSINKIIN